MGYRYELQGRVKFSIYIYYSHPNIPSNRFSSLKKPQLLFIIFTNKPTTTLETTTSLVTQPPTHSHQPSIVIPTTKQYLTSAEPPQTQQPYHFMTKTTTRYLTTKPTTQPHQLSPIIKNITAHLAAQEHPIQTCPTEHNGLDQVSLTTTQLPNNPPSTTTSHQ